MRILESACHSRDMKLTHPLILILNIITVRPLIHLDHKGIEVVFSYHITYVKLCGISTTLTVSNLFAVDPDMVGAVHTIEPKTVQNIILPTIRDREIGLVQACWVLRRNKWRVRGKWVVDIGVVWMTVALELPMTWDISDQFLVESRQNCRKMSQFQNDLIASVLHE